MNWIYYNKEGLSADWHSGKIKQSDIVAASCDEEFTVNGVVIKIGEKIYTPWDGMYKFGEYVIYWINHHSVDKQTYLRAKTKIGGLFY